MTSASPALQLVLNRMVFESELNPLCPGPLMLILRKCRRRSILHKTSLQAEKESTRNYIGTA
jgi:hypothetical protein